MKQTPLLTRFPTPFWQDLRCSLCRAKKKTPHKHKADKEPLRKNHCTGRTGERTTTMHQGNPEDIASAPAGRQEHFEIRNQHKSVLEIMSTRGWRVGGLALTAAAQPRILLLWRVFVLGHRLGFFVFSSWVLVFGKMCICLPSAQKIET